jgi:hypothetical protein
MIAGGMDRNGEKSPLHCVDVVGSFRSVFRRGNLV